MVCTGAGSGIRRPWTRTEFTWDMLGAPSNLLNGPFFPSFKKLYKKLKMLFPLPEPFTPLLVAASLSSSASLCVFSSPQARLLPREPGCCLFSLGRHFPSR